MKRRTLVFKWLPPVVTVVALPSHAQTSVGVIRPLDLIATTNACDDTAAPSTATFTICNNEGISIEITRVNVQFVGRPNTGNGVDVISPTLPLTILASGCVTFSVVNSGSQSFMCGDAIILDGTRVGIPSKGSFGFII